MARTVPGWVAAKAGAAAKEAAAPVATGNYPVIKGKEAIEEVEAYAAATAQLDLLEGEIKRMRDSLIKRMGGAPVAHIGVRTLTVTDVPEMPAVAARKITREMIGQELPGKRGRKAYQQLRVQ